WLLGAPSLIDVNRAHLPQAPLESQSHALTGSGEAGTQTLRNLTPSWLLPESLTRSANGGKQECCSHGSTEQNTHGALSLSQSPTTWIQFPNPPLCFSLALVSGASAATAGNGRGRQHKKHKSRYAHALPAQG